MKKSHKALIFIAFILAIALMAAALFLFAPAGVTTVDGISFSVPPDTVTPAGAVYTVINETDGIVTFGAPYTIEKKGLLGWRKCLPHPLVTGWTAIAYVAWPTATQDLNWSYLYGGLSPGTYRLVKKINAADTEYTLAAEFTVQNNKS